MNINEFVRERKAQWERLEQIASRVAEGKAESVTREELWDLSRLYFAAVSDLSLLKSSPMASDPDNQVIHYLNGLVTRAHGAVYGKPRLKWTSVREFVTVDFPEAFRKNRWYVAVSASIMILSGIVGFFLSLHAPAFMELLVPEGIIEKVEKGGVWFKEIYGIAPMASSGLMTHNTSVTFLVFAAGMLFGVGTVYLLAFNGLLLGAVAALCYRHGLSLEFWSFVLPHGSMELTAIFIAGGGGLILGQALLDPGPYRRSEVLAVRAKQAVTLVLGCVPLLVVAGITEAFFSPSEINPWVKMFAATNLFVALMALLFLSGHNPEAKEPRLGEHGGSRVVSSQ